MTIAWEEREAQAEQEREDPLGAFKAMIFGAIFSLPFWAFTAYIWWMTR